MATLEITALDTFTHGRLHMVRGDKETIEASEARELEQAGLVSTAKAPKTATDSKPAEDDLDDLVGGKAEAAPQNKMEPAPANKGAAPKPKK